MYSLKWYRDDVEFYRSCLLFHWSSLNWELRIVPVGIFLPRTLARLCSLCLDSRCSFSRKMRNIFSNFSNQVLAHSSPTHIILNNAASDTSGVFRCEVSAGPPRFSTASRTTHLQIVGETKHFTDRRKKWDLSFLSGLHMRKKYLRYWSLDYSCERLGSIKSYKRMKIC